MVGVIVNTLAVIVGGVLGCIFNKSFNKKVADAVMFGIGLCTVYIGISGMLDGGSVLILIVSIAIGAALGTLADLDERIRRASKKIEARFWKDDGRYSLAEGIVSGSLLFCIGAMTIVGSLNAGFGDNTMLFTKSMLDFVASMVLATTMGAGVALSAVVVFVFQGAIALCAVFIKPYLDAGLIAEISCVGSLLVAMIGLNLSGFTKTKVANYLPALIIAPILYFIVGLLPF